MSDRADSTSEASHRLPGVRRRFEVLMHPVVVVGLALIGLQLLLRTWAMSSSWFYTDDFVMLLEALDSPLSPEYLLRPENGHVMPATRLFYSAVAHAPGLSWPLAAGVALVLQLIASLSALWCLVTMFGPRRAILPLLAVYLSSAMTAQASLWLISAWNQTPVQITFFVATGCWVIHLRSGRLLWLLGCVGAVLFGLLFFQKALLVLPLMAVLALCYFAEGGLLQRLRHLAVRFWAAGLALCGVGLLATLDYLIRVPSGGGTDRGSVQWWSLVRQLVLEALPSGMAGGPWGWHPADGGSLADPPTLVLVWSWCVAAAVVGGSIVMRRRAARAWLLVVVHYALVVVLVGVSRAAVFGADIGSAYRLQTEGLVVIVLATGLAWLPLRGAPQHSVWRSRDGGGRVVPALPVRSVAAVLTGLIVLGGLTSWVRYVAQWRDISDAKPFAQGVMEADARFPGVELTNREVPRSILSDLLRPRNRLADVAPLLAPSARFPTVTERLSVVADDGTLAEAVLRSQAQASRGPVPDCGWAVTPGEPLLVPLDAPPTLAPRWVSMPYFVSDTGTVTVVVGGERHEVTVLEGLHNLYVRVQGNVDDVILTDLGTRGALCVTAVEVGTMGPGAER